MATLEQKRLVNIDTDNFKFAPNHAILLKQTTRTNAKTNEISVVTDYIEICPIKDTKPVTIVQSIIRFLLAETQCIDGFNRTYTETGIKMRSIFRKYLSGNTICRSDSNGKLVSCLVSDVPLKQTALNIKDAHTIMTCPPENLKAAIYNHAKAVTAQCEFISNIKDRANVILAAMDENGTVKATKKGTQKADVSNVISELEATK